MHVMQGTRHWFCVRFGYCRCLICTLGAWFAYRVGVTHALRVGPTAKRDNAKEKQERGAGLRRRGRSCHVANEVYPPASLRPPQPVVPGNQLLFAPAGDQTARYRWVKCASAWNSVLTLIFCVKERPAHCIICQKFSFGKGISIPHSNKLEWSDGQFLGVMCKYALKMYCIVCAMIYSYFKKDKNHSSFPPKNIDRIRCIMEICI